MLSRKIEAFQKDEKHFSLQKQWKNFDAISPHLAIAVIAAEDQKFSNHFGFDFEAMRKAIQNNLKKSSKRSGKTKGASTISQQTAKNVFLWQGRTYLRKILEAYFTILIELFWSKKRILEVYLNVAETGNLCFGAEAAAQKYFHKKAAQLSLQEAALIAVCLPSPRKYNPSFPSKYINMQKNRCLRSIEMLGGANYLKQIN